MNKNAKRFKCARDVKFRKEQVAGRPAEWIVPKDAMTDATMLYLHRGAYTVVSAESHRTLMTHIAAASMTPVLLLEYRLAPEHSLSAALDDEVAAFMWIVHSLNNPAGHIVIGGDSAGSGLSMATALRLRDTRLGIPVLLCPWTDLTISGPSVELLKAKDLFSPPETYSKILLWSMLPRLL